MALSVKDLSPAAVQQAELTLSQFIKDEFPSMDLSRGRVLRELLIRPAAMFFALNEDNMDRLRRSMSIQQISQDPTLATSDIVDGVLSNLLLTRDAGLQATGQLRIVVSASVVTPIDSDAVFTANGLNYTVTQSFVGVTSASNVVNTGSRLIVSRSDGNFEFLVDVQAEAAGTVYNASDGTRFTINATIPRLVDVVAAFDFVNGRAREDNATLANRAQQGLSPRVLSGRSHIEALLQSNFSEIASMSVIGFGDIEMIRDRHNLFATSHGGKVDIYVRTGSIPERALLTKTAAVSDETTGKLTVTLSKDDVAGGYEVLAVYRVGDTPFQLNGTSEPTLLDSLPIITKTWTHNATATGVEFVPDIATTAEAAYTRYRQVVLEFTDNQSSLKNGETADYQIYLLRMPKIAEIQDFINDRGIRSPAADYLVRAPVPAVCSVGLEIAARNTGEIDISAIKNAVANRVNSLGFSVGHLPGSTVIDAAQGQLPIDGVLDLPINLLAKLHLPDGTTAVVAGTDELRVPDNISDDQVSARTVAWFVRTSDIDVAVRKLVTPDI